MVNLVSIETITQESTGLALCERQKKARKENKRKKVSLINTKDIKPPDESKKKKAGQLWCPLCHEYRTFEKNSILGLRVCSWCGISEEFYYIKKYNNLWK